MRGVKVLQMLESQLCEPISCVHVVFHKVKCTHMHTNKPPCLSSFVMGFGYSKKTLARKMYSTKRQKREEYFSKPQNVWVLSRRSWNCLSGSIRPLCELCLVPSNLSEVMPEICTKAPVGLDKLSLIYTQCYHIQNFFLKNFFSYGTKSF